MSIKILIDDFFSIFYPKLCFACGQKRPIGDSPICINCEVKLPQTAFHLEKHNELTRRFLGRIDLEYGLAYLHFFKLSRTQKLIHHLKYSNQPKIGVWLGKQYGYILNTEDKYKAIDFIIPVPLHPLKQQKRGYNQSDKFAEGLSKTMQIPWLANALIRTKHTKTQTQKSIVARFSNVENAFAIPDPKILENKHILLVDDVITTGATLEACLLKLKEIPNIKLSIAVIAIAI